MDFSKWLHLLDVVTLMNTCIQATLDETLMILMGMLSNFFFVFVLLLLSSRIPRHFLSE